MTPTKCVTDGKENHNEATEPADTSSAMEIEHTARQDSAETESPALFKTPIKRNIIIVRSPVANN